MLPIARRPVPFAGSPLLHATGAALLSLAAGAQTFVVDAANGPGAHFTEITAALQAVPEGAVLRVRAGDYASFTIDGRSVTVLGEPGAVVRSLVNPGHPGVVNLAAHQRVVIRGLQFVPWLGPLGSARMVLQNCAGVVHLEGLSVPFGGSSLDVQQCAHVIVQRCRYFGTVWTANSVVALRDCSVLSTNHVNAALEQSGGRVQVIDCQLNKGYMIGPVARLAGGDLRLLGDSLLDSTSPLNVPGVVVDGTGTLRLDPAVALIGIANPIGPGITASSLPMPHAEANSAPLGGVLTASLDGPAGSLGALSVALPGTPGPIPGLGDPLFWELVTAVPQVAGVLAVGQPLTSTIAVPNVPALAGVAVVHHGFTWAPVGGLQVSNPAAAVVH